MSNIYITEPPTNGKVLLHTSVGDIEIELWSKECPKAVRNFVQLCLEGYYNKTVFHRLVPNFIVQGGDPTGTGEGGESIYGKPFRTETHSRLRFNRRGLVAMSATSADDNRSQFFFTLGATPELERKHTIFGKVVGNTLYNMINLGEGEVDQNERPIYLHRILKTEILSNPFPDIVPRKTKTDEQENHSDKKKQKSTARATKNFSLLSFGEEAEEEEEELSAAYESSAPKHGKSSHDLLDDPRLSKSAVAVELDNRPIIDQEVEEKKKPKPASDEDDKKEELPSNDFSMEENEEDSEKAAPKRKKTVREEIDELKRELAIKRRRQEETKEVKKEEDEDEDEEAVEQTASDAVSSFKAMVKGFKKGSAPKTKKSVREKETMDLFSKFLNKLHKEDNVDESGERDDDAVVDRTSSYLSHRMVNEEKAPVLAMDANTAKDHERYDLYDPRNALNKRRREKK